MRGQTAAWSAPPPRGGITWVSALLLLLLVLGAYLAWTWAPVYLLHVEVKQVAREFMHRAVKNPNDALLVEMMTHKLRTLGEVEVPSEDGTLASVPVVQVEPAEVTWERDADAKPPNLHVAFTYVRPVRYPLIPQWTEASFSIDLTEDLTVPDWGPSQ
ncbi:MAG TPA: hypothetical protein VFG59_21280 [Anaeromyxobacter sp.]|nr:hypothetical protein [Anaeromyxobacter sp.]